jgi:hypothetical protein
MLCTWLAGAPTASPFASPAASSWLPMAPGVEPGAAFDVWPFFARHVCWYQAGQQATLPTTLSVRPSSACASAAAMPPFTFQVRRVILCSRRCKTRERTLVNCPQEDAFLCQQNASLLELQSCLDSRSVLQISRFVSLSKAAKGNAMYRSAHSQHSSCGFWQTIPLTDAAPLGVAVDGSRRGQFLLNIHAF